MRLIWALLLVLPCVTIHAQDNVTDADEEECCDVCELLLPESGSEFYTKCGIFMHELMMEKILKDCDRIQARGIHEEMAIFLSSLKELCYYKEFKEIDFSCPEPDVSCDACDGIGHTECGEHLNPRLLKKIIKDCRMILGWENQQSIDSFWLNLEEMCKVKDYTLDDPDCLCDPEPCDICDEIVNTDCVSQMNQVIQDKLVKDCKYVRDQGLVNFLGFWENLYEICVYKNDTTFEIPDCPPPVECNHTNPECVQECDYCEVMADPESEFQQACGDMLAQLGPIVLDEKIAKCESLEHDPEQLSDFIDELLNICVDGTDTYFEFCRYEPPIIDTDPELECMDKVIDLVFLVDSSGSIDVNEFQSIKSFVKEMIGKFDIGNDKTRVGIINFSNNAEIVVDLDDGNNKLDLQNDVQNMNRFAQWTNTHLAIDAANLMLSGKGRDNAEQAVILVTDGVSTEEHLTFTTMQTFRYKHPDATVLSIGVGNGVDTAELRAMATGLGDTNVFAVDDFDALDGIVEALTVQVCVPVDPENGPVVLDEDEDGDATEFDCTEVLYAADPIHDRWKNHYGVYELQENVMCEGIYMYKHTSYNRYMWRQISNMNVPGEHIWHISTNDCTGPAGTLLAEMTNDQMNEDPLTDGLEVWLDVADNFELVLTTCFYDQTHVADDS